MKKILLLFLVIGGVASAQTASVQVDANGTVINFQSPSTKAVNFPTGKLTVNGVQISGLELDASATVKGVTKLSVAPVSSLNPIAVGDNDSRNTNARTPIAHASTHANAGSDPVTLIISQITGLQSVLDLKAPLASPTLTGIPLAPTAAVDTNTTQIATTGFVLAQAANATPIVASAGAIGASTRYARQDHVHPAQTSVTGNAGTATALQAARTINGTSFDGTENITVAAAAGTLTGTTLASGVTASSLTGAAGGAFGTAAYTASSDYATSVQGAKADNAGAITGIIKSDGSANFSAVIDSSSNWNTAYTDRLKWDGGSTGLTAATGRISLGGTTIGQSVFTLTNPSAITFIRINADNTVDALNATNFRTAIGAGTGNGDAFAANPLSQFAATTSAQLRGILSDEIGAGVALFDGATPTAFTLTNASGLPITGITSSTSSQLRTLLSDENGTGVALFDNATSPTFVTPALGTPSALVLTNATGSPTGISLTKAQLNTIVSDDDPAYLGAANIFTGTTTLNGGILHSAAVIGASTYTWLASTPAVHFNGSVDHTVTLLAPGSYVGMIIYVHNYTGRIVASDASNVVDFLGNVTTSILPAVTGVWATLQSDGAYWRIISGSGTPGTSTNDNAATGNVGEYVSASVVVGSATALTTATPKSVTSISLTAGDWDVTAIGALTGASTGTEFDVAIGTTTNSLTGTVLGDTRCQTPTVSLTGADASLMIPAARVSINATTTYYLIVQETFTIGTPAGYGRISARRAR